jgi:hypothetical protein
MDEGPDGVASTLTVRTPEQHESRRELPSMCLIDGHLRIWDGHWSESS